MSSGRDTSPQELGEYASADATASATIFAKTPSTASIKSLETFPEGGYQAWSVALGSFLALFSTFGVVNSFGVFQEYYQTTLLTKSSSSTISLIGALQLFLLYGLSPFIGRIFDAYGIEIILPLGSFLTVSSMMMTSLCQPEQPYQYFLTQSLLFGVGNALVFTPSLAIVSHWFRRRRSFLIGIIASGSSLGGVVYPLIFQNLIRKTGFPWAMRIAGFVTLTCLSVSCLTMRTRLPLLGNMSLSSAVDLRGFKDPKYILICAAAFLLFYALFIPYFYIETYANYHGVDRTLSRNLLAILNACGMPARIIPGLLADRVGPLNVLIPATYISGILVLGMWLPSRGAVPITLFSALYGLFSGAFVSLLPAYIATIVPRENYGARLGMVYLVIAVANIAGTPTAGAFLPVVDQAHFNGLIVFTGVLVFCGGLAASTILVFYRGR